MTKIQEPEIVGKYKELVCSMLGKPDMCDVEPLVLNAPGGLIVALPVQKHANGGDPEKFGKEICQRIVDAGVDVELVEGMDGLNLVAYLDDTVVPQKAKAAGMGPFSPN